jgi:hypothetical protein
MLKVSSRTSTKTGTASNQATTGGGGEGEGGHQDRLSGFEVLGDQREPQRVGAIGTAQYVSGAAEGGELPLEISNLGAHDVFAVIDDAQDSLVHPPADPSALSAEIDEFDRRILRSKGGGIGHQTISSIPSGPVSR